MNVYYRSIHVHGTHTDLHVELTLQTIFNIIKKSKKLFDASHVVFCLDGKSWRKQVYPKYKANRAAAKLKKTKTELENEEILMEVFNELSEFLEEKTNVTVLKTDNAEADDLIAMWIEAHREDKNIIVSTDEDYVQLISENVWIYQGTSGTIVKPEGVFHEDGKTFLLKDKTHKTYPNPEYFLFKKCIRGDKSDNIFSAYPGIREKGNKSKVGILEAFEDRHNKGFAWNNFMNQKWEDHEEDVHVVKDDYERNKKLIDLTEQPDYIKAECLSEILKKTSSKKKKNVGFHFLKFCGKWGLMNLAKYPDDYARMLNLHYSDAVNKS